VATSVPALTLALLLAASRGSAQSLMVASPAVAIDDRTHTGSVILINDGADPVETSISVFYGYPVTDSLGRMFLRTFTSVDDTMPSAAEWVQSFPRRFQVPARSRRTVRLLVTPPEGLPSGEYWARLVIAAQEGRVAVAGVADTSNVRVALNLVVRSIIGLFYRQGSVTTGVTLDKLRAAVEGDSIVGRGLLTRQGNAAFVGSLTAELKDSAGAVRARTLLPLGVYYTLEPRFALSRREIPAGRYQLAVQVASVRPDVPAGVLLAASPVAQTIDVVLQ
jgi:hypothetical protein